MGIGFETFLQPALQPVFDLIFSEGVKSIVCLFAKLSNRELDGILEKWRIELDAINDVLDDAVAKQFQSKPVQKWLQELQDLAFDMEDVLADFDIQAQHYRFKMNKPDQQDDDDDDDEEEEDDVGHGVMNAVNHVVVTLYNNFYPKVQNKIKGINNRLEQIKSRTHLLPISVTTNTQQQQTLQTEALRSERETSSLQLESNVYGRDEGKQKIITRLLEDDDDSSNESYVVIPIVGCGGIGKTTLAQYVYNDEVLKDHFNLKAWVCVSDVFDVKRITTTIVRTATGSGTHVECSTLDEAQTQLKNILLNRKFLIVLDDVWNCTNNGWQRLKTPFKHAAKGSRVIMTTRNERDARTMIHCPTRDTFIRLKGLSEEDCWNLFQQHANNDSDLAEMRDDIVKKCKGLPLAAKALGGLFKKTVDKSERRMILESNIWTEESGVLPVLRLSYDYLPSQLKCVFAYFSLFPKDYNFEKMEVILLWMAQGFLLNDENHMEDLGHKYFNDLQSRSLLEQSPNQGIFFKGKKFVMHDLIHDLALWATGGICYARGTKNDRERIRHVFLTQDATTWKRQLKAFHHLRTFYGDRVIRKLDFIQSFSYVRTLKLVSGSIKVLPECIGELKHLRFLSLKFDKIIELPESIKYLWNLQTLDLEHCRVLKKVPYVGSLKKLRHLEMNFSEVEMPRGVWKLTNLRTLHGFKLVDGQECRIKELKNLNHLQGQLTIWGLQNVSKVEDAEEAQLHQKSGLDVLHLEWGTLTKKRKQGSSEEHVDYNTLRDVVQQLKPATSITECTLDGYMGLILPGWLGDPSFNNIVTIELRKCNNCEELPPLGQLPCLKRLDIWGMEGLKRVGEEFYGCSNPFPALESLHIDGLKCWEKWEHIAVDSNNRAFPCLQSIQIVRCDSLQGDLPPFLPSLKTLKIKDCRELSVSVSLPNLPLLEKLDVEGCKSVSITTEDVKQGVSEEGNTPTELVHLHLTKLCIGKCPGLISLPEHLALKHLTQLSIITCPGLISLPEHLLLPALKHLQIKQCKNMESLPSDMHKYASLQVLYISECPKLQCFPEGGGLPENLKQLHIYGDIKGVQQWGLHRLHSLERLILFLKDVETEEDFNLSLPSSSLREVKIEGIHNLKNLRVVDGTNLKHFEIRFCNKLESLEVVDGTNLKHFEIRFCNKLESLEVVDGTNLKHLEIENCNKLESLEVANFNSLSTLKLWSCPKLKSLPPLFPTQVLTLILIDLGSSTDAIEKIPGPNLDLPSSLRILTIGGFQNLKTITCSTLPNLENLSITSCPKFESFGETALPSHLKQVYIRECELIKPHLQSDPHGVIWMGAGYYSLC